MARRTLASVERELRALLLSDKIQVRLKAMHHAGYLKNGRVLDVDTFRAGLLAIVVHELIHERYRRELERWGDLEEPLVLTLEDKLERFINRSPRRVEWWRQTIAAKLD